MCKNRWWWLLLLIQPLVYSQLLPVPAKKHLTNSTGKTLRHAADHLLGGNLDAIIQKVYNGDDANLGSIPFQVSTVLSNFRTMPASYCF